MELQQNWLAPSLKNTAFAHSLLCLTALHMVYEHPETQLGSAGLAAYHRIKAISAVQSVLSDPEEAISDETIAAVFNLVCFEESLFNPAVSVAYLRPDVAQRGAHAQGLNQMICMRGGIPGLSSGLGGLLRQFIIR